MAHLRSFVRSKNKKHKHNYKHTFQNLSELTSPQKLRAEEVLDVIHVIVESSQFWYRAEADKMAQKRNHDLNGLLQGDRGGKYVR